MPKVFAEQIAVIYEIIMCDIRLNTTCEIEIRLYIIMSHPGRYRTA